jgi:hypothetical protein
LRGGFFCRGSNLTAVEKSGISKSAVKILNQFQDDDREGRRVKKREIALRMPLRVSRESMAKIKQLK